jgi:3-oxoacyl-[acyl-carrier protein] reductase
MPEIPGYVPGHGLLAGKVAKVTTDELLAELSAKEAFGRPAEPWKVANVIVFLASDYSSCMTGEVVSVSSQHP